MEKWKAISLCLQRAFCACSTLYFCQKKNVLCVSSNAHPRRNVFSARPNKCRVTSGPWLLSSTPLEQSTRWSLFLYFVCRVFLCWMWIICGIVCVFSAEWNYTITCRWLDAVLRFAQIATIWVYVRIIGGLKPKDINDILWTLLLQRKTMTEWTKHKFSSVVRWAFQFGENRPLCTFTINKSFQLEK